MAKVLMALSTFGEAGQESRELLEASGHEIVYNPYGRRVKREEIVELGSDCEGVLAGVEPYDEWVLGHMPDLRCISRAGVGTDAIDHAICADRDIVIRNTPDVVIAPVAELALAMALDLSKRLTWHTERLKAKDWRKVTGRMIADSTVAVVGLGRIGRRVAELFSAVGATVLGVDPYPDVAWAENVGVAIVTLVEALATADVVTLHLTAEDFLLGEPELGSMKSGAIILNLARGKYVDEDALYDAVSSGHLGGAGLDVFPDEPYAGKLCDLDNVVLTPHVATLTRESRLQMEVECVSNLLEELAR
ncbi:MAG: phosphoglycerate dehydrogenase [Deltaproteobacteria bacterium]|nr:phosphoglycerate dehydrogenase [Deltaproteobacteria bacterium]